MEAERTYEEELMLADPFAQEKSAQVASLLRDYEGKCHLRSYIVKILRVDHIGPIVYHSYDSDQNAFVAVRFTALVRTYYPGLVLPLVKITKVTSIDSTARASFLEEATIIIEKCPPELVVGSMVAVKLVTATLPNQRRKFLLTAQIYRRQPPIAVKIGPAEQEAALPAHAAESTFFELPEGLAPLERPEANRVALCAAGRYFEAPESFEELKDALPSAAELIRTARELFAAADAHPEMMPLWSAIYARA